MPEIDFEAEGMLEGLEGEAREARLALLKELSDHAIDPPTRFRDVDVSLLDL